MSLIFAEFFPPSHPSSVCLNLHPFNLPLSLTLHLTIHLFTSPFIYSSLFISPFIYSSHCSFLLITSSSHPSALHHNFHLTLQPFISLFICSIYLFISLIIAKFFSYLSISPVISKLPLHLTHLSSHLSSHSSLKNKVPDEG